MAAIVPTFVSEDLIQKPVGYHVILDMKNGIRLHVSKSLRADWFNVNHRVGWVDQNPMPNIDVAIRKKAAKLPIYRQAAGSDIRLLLVADRTHNSGKFALEKQTPLDGRGFSVVYFFSYPESIKIFDFPPND
jgi:hypothetical protein